MKRTQVINHLIKTYNYKKYLEIGTKQKSQNFNLISCDYKMSVDPSPSSNADFRGTSDEFFKQNKEKFDMIFVDGLHLHEQVYKDIINSLSFLNPNGTIVCHDMLPSNEKEQLREQQFYWTGDCWKAWAKCRSQFDLLQMYIVDTDCGCGVIRRGKQKLIEIPEVLDWNWFIKNKKSLNIVSLYDFFLRN